MVTWSAGLQQACYGVLQKWVDEEREGRVWCMATASIRACSKATDGGFE